MERLLFILLLVLVITLGSSSRLEYSMAVTPDTEKIIDLQVRVAVLEVRLSERDKALEIAEQALLKYQVQNNEWRNENIDQRNLFPTKEDVDGKMNGLEYRISVLEKAGNTFVGEQNTKTSFWTSVTSLVLILITVASVIVNFIQFNRSKKT